MVLDTNGRRVALLARPGLARERLSGVLQEAGANCVITADPTQLKPDDLRDMAPEVVVVALDPLTEEALEQFDEVLGNRSVEVIYEEAEQAASREGWDAARWQRHLVAKLQGHSNVLPPGRESAAVGSPDPAPVDALGIEDAADETPASVAAPSSAPVNAFDPVNAELDGFDLDTAFASFDPSLSGLSLDDHESSAAEPASETGAPEVPAWDESAFAAPENAFSAFDFSLEMDPQPSAGAAPAEAPASGVFDHFDVTGELSLLDVEAEEAPVVAPDEGVDAVTPRAALSLQDEEFEAIAMDTTASRDGFRHDLVDLEQRISSLSLVDDTPRRGPAATGAVLILSGIGGPDAVRQLLGALPTGFSRPVLVQQRLEGGRYDRLVTQLQRATKLTVALAESAQIAAAGTVYILPESIGATAGEGGIRFSDDAGQTVMAALPSSDSAVLLLSGSDPAQVEAAMAHSRAGALVAGQAAEGCYDAAAPDALAACGGEVAAPAALALRLSARWSTRGTFDVQA